MPPPNFPNGMLQLQLPSSSRLEHAQLPIAPSLDPLRRGTPLRASNYALPAPDMPVTSSDADSACETCTDYSQGQPIMASNSGQSNGAAWNPAALLNPRHTPRPQLTPRRPDSAPTVRHTPSSELGFNFSTPDNTSSIGPPTAPASSSQSTIASDVAQPSLSFSFASADDSVNTPGQGDTASSENTGMGSMIERMNNVRDRAFAPPPKKRRVDVPGELSARKPGGPGGLGEYIKEESIDLTVSPKPASNTVDLTEGRPRPWIQLPRRALDGLCY